CLVRGPRLVWFVSTRPQPPKTWPMFSNCSGARRTDFLSTRKTSRPRRFLSINHSAASWIARFLFPFRLVLILICSFQHEERRTQRKRNFIKQKRDGPFDPPPPCLRASPSSCLGKSMPR